MTPTLEQLYRDMLRIRRVEETIAARYREQRMRCPTHLSIGQEAVAVGVCAALRRDDWAVSTHRAHAHYLAKGGDLHAMIAEIHGKATGCCRGKGGSMHLVDMSAGFLGSTAIVGNSIPLGVGAALGAQLRGEDRIGVVFMGDAALEEGAFHEAANFAVLRKLAVLFVCENNLYSVYSPLSVRQPEGRPLHAFAAGYGMSVAEGFGNDVRGVFASTRDAVAELREGRGPVFLEFSTYRWREHCGPNYDNDIGYRGEAEFMAWQAREPLAEARRAGGFTEAQCLDWDRGVQTEIDAVFARALADPFPDAHEMATQVYAGEPA